MPVPLSATTGLRANWCGQRSYIMVAALLELSCVTGLRAELRALTPPPSDIAPSNDPFPAKLHDFVTRNGMQAMLACIDEFKAFECAPPGEDYRRAVIARICLDEFRDAEAITAAFFAALRSGCMLPPLRKEVLESLNNRVGIESLAEALVIAKNDMEKIDAVWLLLESAKPAGIEIINRFLLHEPSAGMRDWASFAARLLADRSRCLKISVRGSCQYICAGKKETVNFAGPNCAESVANPNME